MVRSKHEELICQCFSRTLRRGVPDALVLFSQILAGSLQGIGRNTARIFSVIFCFRMLWARFSSYVFMMSGNGVEVLDWLATSMSNGTAIKLWNLNLVPRAMPSKRWLRAWACIDAKHTIFLVCSFVWRYFWPTWRLSLIVSPTRHVQKQRPTRC